MPTGTLAAIGPYRLADSAGGPHDPTRNFRGGVLWLRFALAGRVVEAQVRQRRDGVLAVELAGGPLEAALDHVRFVLGLDDDHAPFLELARADPLLAPVAAARAGLRPLRTSTVAQALLRAFCGQLVQAREAIAVERRIVRALAADRAAPLPPSRDALGGAAPAMLAAHGLAGRRAAALVRILRGLDPERLHGVATPAVVARLTREPGLGPWSAGVVALYGLGRYDHGLVGDLGLIKLLRTLRGRPVEAHETAELLAPYGPWAGLASVYLLAVAPRAAAPAARISRGSLKATSS